MFNLAALIKVYTEGNKIVKAYGVPRDPDAGFSDKADIKRFGFSTQDRCSRADRGKNKARLIWRKKARIGASIEIRESVNMFLLNT